MAYNNIVSVKVGNKVYSFNGNDFTWTDVTSEYPYVGGTLQTEFEIDDPSVTETGSHLVEHDRIWELAKFDKNVCIVPIRPTYDSQTSTLTIPLYFESYNRAPLYSDAELQNPLTEFPQEGDTFYYPDIDTRTVSNVTLYSTITAGSTATDVPPAPPVEPYDEPYDKPYDKPLIYNPDLDCIEKSLGNIEVVGDFKAGSITTPELNAAEITTPSLTATDATIDDLTVNNPVENLTVENLTVTDTATIAKSIVQETEQVTSTEDTIVLRENAVTPVPARGSGVIINNYDGNGTPLGILADSDGTVRVGAEGEIRDTFENGIFYFNSKVYQKGSGATIVGGSNEVHPTGSMLTGTLAPLSADYSKVVIMPNNDRLGLIINGDYYVTAAIVGGGVATLNITNGETVVSSYSQTSDTTFIDNIDNGTDIKDTIYGYSGPVTFGTATDLQPIATREEASVLNNNDLFAWSAADNQLKHITRPTINGTALKAIVTNGAVTGYDWGSSGGSGVSFIGTRTAYNTAKLIPEGQDGHIPAGSLVIITDEDELVLGEEV